MALQSNFIAVTLRSHATPAACIEGFELGKKLQIKAGRQYNRKRISPKVFP